MQTEETEESVFASEEELDEELDDDEKRRRLMNALLPHVRIDVSVKLPGRSNYTKVMGHAEQFMTEEQLFHWLETIRRFKINQLYWRQRRHDKLVAISAPEAITNTTQKLVTLSKRFVNILDSICSWRGSRNFLRNSYIGCYRFWQEKDSVERKRREIEAEEAKTGEENLSVMDKLV